MPKEEPKKEIVVRPPSPGITNQNGGQWKPEQLDPELANIAMAERFVQKLGTPSIINKKFNIRKAIALTLNHVPETVRIVSDAYEDTEGVFHPTVVEVINKGNPTGIDCSLRVNLYEAWERGSVNEGGIFFTSFWAYLNKPKYIINGIGGMGGLPQEEEKESLAGKIAGWFKGGKKNDAANNK